MNVSLDPVWLLTFLLVFVRALAWLVIVPPFSNRSSIPIPALIGIAGGLAILGVHVVPPSTVPTDTPGLLGALVIQVFSGVLLGLPVSILLNAISSAGSMIDLFGGLNPPPALDPLSLNQVPIMGQLYEQVATVLLFVTNGEMLLVKGFTLSLSHGGLTLSGSGTAAGILTGDLATYFTAALEIAAPLVAVLFATQVGLALLSKAAPQLNVWVLGFPIQAMLSLLCVAVGVRVLPGYLGNIIERIGQDMTALVGAG